MESRTPQEVLALAKDSGAEFVDLRFCDLPGVMQHFSMPIHELTEDGFEDGYGFDGSSIRGFQEIQESDMLLIPDPDTAVMDPFRQHPTINVNCFVQGPGHRRVVLARPALRREEGRGVPQGHRHRRHCVLRSRGRVLHLRPGALRPEPALGVLLPRLVRGCVELRAASPTLDGSPNLGYKPRYKEGYFPVPPMDSYQDLRSEMVKQLETVGIEIEVQHHEVGTAGQAEIDMRFDDDADDGRQAHALQVRRQERGVGSAASRSRSCRSRSSRTTARACTSTSRCGRAASRSSSTRRATAGCRTWRGGTSAGCSSTRRAVIAFTNPTTNSYKRLVPGYEAPVNLVYSARNRSASVRIPLFSNSPKAKRLEFRCPDPSCNPYLAFAAMLMAGLDGIQNKIEPPTPVDRDLYDLPAGGARQGAAGAGFARRGADRRSRADHDFLLTGGVFTQDVIDTWISYKRETEIDAVRLRPHPWEFYLYYDI